MLKINIAFDLDGVLVPTMPVVRDIMNADCVDIVENGRFQVETTPMLTTGEIWRYFRLAFAYQATHNVAPYYGAVELLRRLYEMTGEPPKIITSRPIDEANHTLAMTSRCFRFPHQVIMAGNRHDKIKHLHGIDYFVDDRRATAIDLAAAGKGVYVPRKDASGRVRHYNEIPPGTDGVFEISTIADLLPICSSFVKKLEVIL